MLKKVRIHIVSERREATGSLFDSAEGSPALDNTAPAPAAEPERIEMTLEGSYLDDGERVTISYKEGELSGMEGSSTSVSFHKGNPGLISMLRNGSVKTAMIFEKGRRHFCIYQTPVMPFEVCIFTRSVTNLLEQDGKLTLDYTVELRGAQAEQTHFSMRVLPIFARPVQA